MLKKLNGKTEKTEPPLRNYATFKGRPGLKRKNLSFDAALTLLKRKHKIKRECWNGFCLHLVVNIKGDKTIYSKSINVNSASDGVKHSFDQTEILANDWMTV